MKIIAHSATRTQRGRGLTLVWGIHPFAGGKMLVALSAEGLCWLGLNCGPDVLQKNWPGAELVEDQKITRAPAQEISRRWPRGLEGLSVPVVLYGTPFQLKVWKALLKIKSGSTTTYADIARRIGAPLAARAVGSAVGKNPVSVVVPCHRVVNAQAGIVNYGWGPAAKKALLKGEGAL